MFGLAFHHQHGLFGSSVGQHLPAVPLTHVPAKEKDREDTVTDKCFLPQQPLSFSLPLMAAQGKSLLRYLFMTERWQETISKRGKRQQGKEKLKRKHQRAQLSGGR